MNNPSEWQEQKGAEVIDDKTELALPEENLSDDIKAHRALVAEKCDEVLKAKNLPGFGESKLWVNPNLPDKQPENPDKPEIKVMSWNVQRGFKVDQQIEEVKKIDPDILCLQEVDIECERTGKKNVALELAAGAGYKYCLFTTQVAKADGGVRKKELDLTGGGVHGVAILSKYPITKAEAMKLTVDKFHTFIEKRIMNVGGRVAQKAIIQVGNRELVVYNTHMSPLNEGTAQRLAEWDKIANDAEKETRPTIISGDLNTLGHGVSNMLMPKDALGKLRRWGQKDSEYWEETEFGDSKKREQLEDGILDPRKKRFTDPNKESTYKMPGIFNGKLDYVLLENGKISPISNEVINTKASDHMASVVTARMT